MCIRDRYGDKIEVVFCNNDAMAMGALQSIQQAGRTVGKDVYLVGVEDVYKRQPLLWALPLL